MLTLSIKLILAHILGDFAFQPKKWVKDKEKKRIRSRYLYFHIVVHAVLLLLVLQFNTAYFGAIALIVGSHYLIDLAKLYTMKLWDSRWLFFIDQLLHIVVLAAVVYYYFPYPIEPSVLFSEKIVLLLTFLLLTTVVSSVVMNVIISKWKLKNTSKKSLKKAGTYIGVLERLFIFLLIVVNYWEGIGFLLAAKSIFRFGDLTKAKDRRLTEYILIGTLLSFGLAVVCGAGYVFVVSLLQ